MEPCPLRCYKKGQQWWVYSVLRKRYVVLTPEEWVRQQLIQWMINALHYPKGLLNEEVALNYQGRRYRVDIIAYTPQGTPLLIIECKHPEMPLSEKHLYQLNHYRKLLKPRMVFLSNFYQTIGMQVEPFKRLDTIPDYKSLFLQP